MQITAQGCRLRNDLYCVEWDVKLCYTIPYLKRVVICIYTVHITYASLPKYIFSQAGGAGEPAGIRVQNFHQPQLNLPQNKSPVPADSWSSGVRREPVLRSPKRSPQWSPVSPSLSVSSSSLTPPPLPQRVCLSSSGRSSLDSLSTAKRYRPPPPIPDEPFVSVSPSQRDSLSLPQRVSLSLQPAAEVVRSVSPAARRSTPVVRYSVRSCSNSLTEQNQGSTVLVYLLPLRRTLCFRHRLPVCLQKLLDRFSQNSMERWQSTEAFITF